LIPESRFSWCFLISLRTVFYWQGSAPSRGRQGIIYYASLKNATPYFQQSAKSFCVL